MEFYALNFFLNNLFMEINVSTLKSIHENVYSKKHIYLTLNNHFDGDIIYFPLKEKQRIYKC